MYWEDAVGRADSARKDCERNGRENRRVSSSGNVTVRITSFLWMVKSGFCSHARVSVRQNVHRTTQFISMGKYICIRFDGIAIWLGRLSWLGLAPNASRAGFATT